MKMGRHNIVEVLLGMFILGSSCCPVVTYAAFGDFLGSESAVEDEAPITVTGPVEVEADDHYQESEPVQQGRVEEVAPSAPVKRAVRDVPFPDWYNSIYLPKRKEALDELLRMHIISCPGAFEALDKSCYERMFSYKMKNKRVYDAPWVAFLNRANKYPAQIQEIRRLMEADSQRFPYYVMKPMGNDYEIIGVIVSLEDGKNFGKAFFISNKPVTIKTAADFGDVFGDSRVFLVLNDTEDMPAKLEKIAWTVFLKKAYPPEELKEPMRQFLKNEYGL